MFSSKRFWCLIIAFKSFFKDLYVAFGFKVYWYLAEQMLVCTVLYLAFWFEGLLIFIKETTMFTVLYVTFGLRVYWYLEK